MDAEATELANRVRALLSSEPALEERRMFGAHVFLLDGRILVGARGRGTLLVRLTAEHGLAMQTRVGARIATMGDRTMGPSWLEVERAALDDAGLRFWIDAARRDSVSI